ncbi:type II toxin-antitoxin system MqsA family antitoxin (plasmid) [Ensifer sp. D2-11]
MAERPDPEITPADIRRIRERLGLTQVEAGETIGGGPRAFAKYENGVIKPAASVANLLLVLDRSPEQLEALTGRPVPVDTTDLLPLEVSHEHVRSLSSSMFALLVQRLLEAEVLTYGLPTGGMHVAVQLTVGDGGEDAFMSWEGGPARTRFLPSRRTQFQLKASPISPAAAGRDVLDRDGRIKPMIRRELEAGATYMMLVTHPSVRQTMVRHEEAIRESLSRAGFQAAEGQIEVLDGSQVTRWVNSHPGVAAWLLGRVHPGLSIFRDWNHWAGRHEHDRSPWVEDARLQPLQSAVLAAAGTRRGVLRIVGPSGIGKSRLVLEALAGVEGEIARTSGLVLYAVEEEAGTHAVVAAVQSIVDTGRRAIVVIDHCAPSTHDDLAASVRRSGSNVSLVTIDHEFDPEGSSEGTLVVEGADDSVVSAIVQNIRPDMQGSERGRVVRLASGNPQAAMLIGEAWEVGTSFSEATLSERILTARSGAESATLLKAGMLLAVFGAIGLRSDLNEVTSIATIPAAPGEAEMRDGLEGVLRRGVGQLRGRMLVLQPAQLSLSLAKRQWRLWTRRHWRYVLAELPDVGLRNRAARRLAMLNREPVARDVVLDLCAWDGPFSSLKAIAAEGATGILSALAEIDARVVGDLLDRVLDGSGIEELRSIEGEARRHLVWTLSKTAFAAEGFEIGARLLLRLAVAENETWGNNATGEFKGLFAPFSGATEARGPARLLLVEEIAGTGNDEELTILVDALLAALNWNRGSRLVGPEEHGTRPALQPWQPQTWGEVWDYLGACIAALTDFACRPDALGQRARAGLGSNLRLLVDNQLIGDVERAVGTVIEANGNYWPEALESLGHVLEYDREGLNAGEKDRVRALVELLTPRDLPGRVRLLVSEMPWDYPTGENLEFDERERRQQEEVEELAKELLGEPGLLSDLLPELSQGEQRMGAYLGRCLAMNSGAPVDLLEDIVTAYLESPPDHENAALLGGFVGELAVARPAVADELKRRAVGSAKLAPALPYLCAAIGLQPGDVAVVIEAIRSGLLLPHRMRSWMFGGQLRRLSAGDLAPLVDLLLDGDDTSVSVVLDLLGAFAHGEPAGLEGLRPQLRQLATKAGSRLRGQSDAHHFNNLVSWLLDKGRGDEDATFVASTLARVAVTGENVNETLVRPLMARMLRDFPEVVWPILGQAITGDRRQSWRLELALGDGFSFRNKTPALIDLPEAVLLSWCSAYPDTAPAFAAGLLPILTSRDVDDTARALHPRMVRLLEEFGDRPDVLKALDRNMGTFGWTGSTADYYALFDGPLGTLSSHRHGNLRRWASRTRERLRAAISKVHGDEAERDALE